MTGFVDNTDTRSYCGTRQMLNFSGHKAKIKKIEKLIKSLRKELLNSIQ